MDAHDFGPVAKYFFKPCEIADDVYDEMVQPVDPSGGNAKLRP